MSFACLWGISRNLPYHIFKNLSFCHVLIRIGIFLLSLPLMNVYQFVLLVKTQVNWNGSCLGHAQITTLVLIMSIAISMTNMLVVRMCQKAGVVAGLVILAKCAEIMISHPLLGRTAKQYAKVLPNLPLTNVSCLW